MNKNKKNSRRQFLKLGAGSAAGAVIFLNSNPAKGNTSVDYVKTDHILHPNSAACLVDITKCIGCRQCELGCRISHDHKIPEVNTDNIAEKRRPDSKQNTVVNNFKIDNSDNFVKIQCMHCLKPACESACIVGALTKRADGPVVYDADKCIGCRYCMVACPYEIPAYEYHNSLTPEVVKCDFCTSLSSDDKKESGPAGPSCAKVCPTGALLFGNRETIIKIARGRIEADKDRYFPHVYGEFEAGGTSWIYLGPADFSNFNLPPFEKVPSSQLTEAIQHGIFKFGAAPVAFYGALAALMHFKKRNNDNKETGKEKSIKDGDKKIEDSSDV
ncbi:MAG: 4Fe-4S dicluster domain-containing protein [Deltaproteobacteria bacterium]|nr:4Fe-4S dicluster domain-containing protein [Deltaproteobacteria bacterium]